MVDVAPLYTDQSPLTGTMPLVPPDTRSAPFWSSLPRPITSPVTEVCEVRLHGPRLVNYIRASVPHFPHEVRLEYWDEVAEAWAAVLDANSQPVRNRVFDSKPMRISPSTFKSVVQHPMHQGDNHWTDLSWKVPPVTAQRWRFLLTRVPGIGPVDASTGSALDYPLGLQDIDLGYRVYSADDIPADATETPGFASSLDYLGSRVEYGVRRLEPDQALGTAGVGWRSDPQPVSYGVINYFMDVRDSNGKEQIIDRFFVDPLTPGVHCNLYYANAAPPPPAVTAWTIAASDFNVGHAPTDTYPNLPEGYWKQIGVFTPNTANVSFSAPEQPAWETVSEDEYDFILRPLSDDPTAYSGWGDIDAYGWTDNALTWQQSPDSSVLDVGTQYAAMVYVWRAPDTLATAVGQVVDYASFIAEMRAQGTFVNTLAHPDVVTEDDYAAMEWTPIPRDYILARGFMNLPPTKAAFFKFEFTNLVAEHYEVFVPISRTVKLFRTDTVAEYEGIVKSDRADPTPGYRAQRALSAYQRYLDAIDLLVAGDAAYSVSPTLALTASNDPDLAARLRRTGWVWNFDPWHIGLGAPRFTKKQVHVYDEAQVSHLSRIAYFVGLKMVQPYKVDPLANEDTPQYDFHFNVDDATVLSGSWVVQSTNGVTYDDNVAVFDSAAASISSQALNSQRGVRAVQYATVQSPPAQIMPDPDLLQPLFHWGTWGDAAAYSLRTGGIHVQRGYATTFYANLDDQPYSDLEAMGLYGNVEGATTSTGQFGGGIESEVLVPSALGHITAVATVTTDDVLTGPLTLQIVSETNVVLAETDFWLSQGETVKARASYDLGTAAPAQPYSTLEDRGTYGDLESSTYAELEGTPIFGSIKIRVIQIGTQRNEFSVLRVGVFDDPLVWEFSNNNGLTWWAAPGIRNDPYGVLPFPLNVVGQWPDIIDTFARPDGPLADHPLMDSGVPWFVPNWGPTQILGGQLTNIQPDGNIYTTAASFPVPVTEGTIEFTYVSGPHPSLTAYEASIDPYIFTIYDSDQNLNGAQNLDCLMTDRSVFMPGTRLDFTTAPNATEYRSDGTTVPVHIIEDGSVVRITYAADGQITIYDDGVEILTFNPLTDNDNYQQTMYGLRAIPQYRGFFMEAEQVGGVLTGTVVDDLSWRTTAVPSGSSTYGSQLRWRVRGFQEAAWVSALAIRPWYQSVNGPLTPDYGSIIGPNRTPLDHYGPIDNDPMWRAQDNSIDSFLDAPLRGGDGMTGPLSTTGHEPAGHTTEVFENLVTSESVTVAVNGEILAEQADVSESIPTTDGVTVALNYGRTASDVTTMSDQNLDSIIGPANPPPVYVAASGAPTSAYDSFNGFVNFTYTPPPGTQVGDLLLLQQYWWTFSGQTISGPTPGTWVEVGRTPNSDGTEAVFAKVADATDAAGTSSYVISDHTGSADTVRSGGQMHAIRGADTSSLAYAHAGAEGRNAVPNVLAPALTAAVPRNTKVFHFIAGSDRNATYVLDAALSTDNVYQSTTQDAELVVAHEVIDPSAVPTARTVQFAVGEEFCVLAVAVPPTPYVAPGAFTDTFNRSDRDINGDSGWLTHYGAMGIASNKLVATTLAADPMGFTSTLATHASGLTGTHQATLDADPYLVLACTPTADTYVVVRWSGVYRRAPGASSLTPVVTGWPSMGTYPFTCSVTVVDNGDGTFTGTVRRNGVLAPGGGTFTVAIPAGGSLRSGVFSDTTGMGADDFSYTP